MSNLIETIRDEMNDDSEDWDDQSDYLRRAYESANPDQRDKLDEAFIALCGWSLTTLIGRLA